MRPTLPLLALLLSLAACSPLPAEAQPSGDVLVVANQGGISVSIVDVEARRTLATLPMQAAPHEVATTADGAWALVTNYGDGQTVGHTLAVLDLRTLAVARWIDVAPHTRPHDVEFLPGDSLFVVTSETSRAILVVGFADGRIRRVLPTGKPGSHMLAVPADGRRVFSANIPTGDATELAIDGTGTGRAIPLVAASEAIAVTPDGQTLWSGSRSEHTVVVVDVASGQRLTTFEAPGSPFRVTMSPDARRAVVSLPMADAVRIYSVAERRELALVSVPGGPVGGIIAPDARTMYVSLNEAGEVAVLDLDTGTVTARLPVGLRPDGLGVVRRR